MYKAAYACSVSLGYKRWVCWKNTVQSRTEIDFLKTNIRFLRDRDLFSIFSILRGKKTLLNTWDYDDPITWNFILINKNLFIYSSNRYKRKTPRELIALKFSWEWKQMQENKKLKQHKYYSRNVSELRARRNGQRKVNATPNTPN